jgi:hypothetical protein
MMCILLNIRQFVSQMKDNYYFNLAKRVKDFNAAVTINNSPLGSPLTFYSGTNNNRILIYPGF